jgi:hypothetical protein
MASYVNLIYIALGVGIFCIWLSRRISSRRRFDGLPRIGIDPGLFGLRIKAAQDEFLAGGQLLLEQGYAKV